MNEGTTHEPILLTVPEAASMLRISKSAAYQMVAEGKLPSVRLRSMIRIPLAELRAAFEKPQPKEVVEIAQG